MTTFWTFDPPPPPRHNQERVQIVRTDACLVSHWLTAGHGTGAQTYKLEEAMFPICVSVPNSGLSSCTATSI